MYQINRLKRKIEHKKFLYEKYENLVDEFLTREIKEEMEDLIIRGEELTIDVFDFQSGDYRIEDMQMLLAIINSRLRGMIATYVDYNGTLEFTTSIWKSIPSGKAIEFFSMVFLANRFIRMFLNIGNFSFTFKNVSLLSIYLLGAILFFIKHILYIDENMELLQYRCIKAYDKYADKDTDENKDILVNILIAIILILLIF